MPILPGSYRFAPRRGAPAGQAPNKRITITLVLQESGQSQVHPETLRLVGRPRQEELTGAGEAAFHAVEAFAQKHGFLVSHAHPASRTVKLTGWLYDFAEVFHATLVATAIDCAVYRTRHGGLHVPEELATVVEAVLGLDERPVARTHHRLPRNVGPGFRPRQVADLYQFPTNQGAGQTIALIELGGGFRQSDLTAYFGHQDVSVTAVSVDGALNAPSGDPESDDGEVALDIQVCGAIAPQARLVVYFAPNTDAGFLNAINTAIHDKLRNPSVLSISWGAPEIDWSPASMNAFHAAFHDAALLGVTVIASSGDNGSDDGVGDGQPHVDFPASSPWVLACGGTRLLPLPPFTNRRLTESVWNDGAVGGATGGGVSKHFSKPLYYQDKVVVPGPGRGVPDVAGNADPQTGYQVLVDGIRQVVGGTSAVAPLWASLVALINENLGHPVGWIHQLLYNNPGLLQSIANGTNDISGLSVYAAKEGWNPCCGLGSPNGLALQAALKKHFHGRS